MSFAQAIPTTVINSYGCGSFKGMMLTRVFPTKQSEVGQSRMVADVSVCAPWGGKAGWQAQLEGAIEIVMDEKVIPVSPMVLHLG